MESSISFWTNSLLKMISSYVFISRTKLSVKRYFPLPSFINIISFATSQCESKEGRHLNLNHPPTHTLLFTIFLIKSNSWLTSSVSPIMPPRYPGSWSFLLSPTSSIPVLQTHRVYSIFRPSLWMLRFLSWPHPNHFIFLSIFSLFQSLKTNFFYS